ncbi:unnamed protein product [Paramecium sonneborni]|uniref:Uncharacterized protein n=1 Tax=Paramecium sonneborni TaxID=65129 RepID=A0A8S1M6Y1_9CILI|nr:unnamed protein product [Paramecium sonneborni]
MNCLNYFDQSLLLQQQLILQQMLIYNQMLKASQRQSIPTSKISIEKQIETEITNSQLSKHDDTNPIHPQQEQNRKSKSLKSQQKKEIKKSKKQNHNNVQPDEHPKIKKVFLSMMDIKEVQYKKSKAENKRDNQQNETQLVNANM